MTPPHIIVVQTYLWTLIGVAKSFETSCENVESTLQLEFIEFQCRGELTSGFKEGGLWTFRNASVNTYVVMCCRRQVSVQLCSEALNRLWISFFVDEVEQINRTEPVYRSKSHFSAPDITQQVITATLVGVFVIVYQVYKFVFNKTLFFIFKQNRRALPTDVISISVLGTINNNSVILLTSSVDATWP
jgi:hypothetical protein